VETMSMDVEVTFGRGAPTGAGGHGS
jgi:hypothetical protein